MSVSLPHTFSGLFFTVVKFTDIKNDAGIRSYHWLTALFLKCFCMVEVVKISASEKLYLNKRSFQVWKTRHINEHATSKDHLWCIKKACSVAYEKLAMEDVANGLLPNAFDNFKKAAQKIGDKNYEADVDTWAAKSKEKLKEAFTDPQSIQGLYDKAIAQCRELQKNYSKNEKLYYKTLKAIEKYKTILKGEHDYAWLEQQGIAVKPVKVTTPINTPQMQPLCDACVQRKDKMNLVHAIQQQAIPKIGKMAEQEFQEAEKEFNMVMTTINTYLAISDKQDVSCLNSAETVLSTRTAQDLTILGADWKTKIDNRLSCITQLKAIALKYPWVFEKETVLQEKAKEMLQAETDATNALSAYKDSPQVKQFIETTKNLREFYTRVIEGKDKFADMTPAKEDSKLSFLFTIDPSVKDLIEHCKKGTEVEQALADRFVKHYVLVMIATKCSELHKSYESVLKSAQQEQQANEALKKTDFEDAFAKLKDSAKNIEKVLPSEYQRLMTVAFGCLRTKLTLNSPPEMLTQWKHFCTGKQWIDKFKEFEKIESLFITMNGEFRFIPNFNEKSTFAADLEKFMMMLSSNGNIGDRYQAPIFKGEKFCLPRAEYDDLWAKYKTAKLARKNTLDSVHCYVEAVLSVLKLMNAIRK